MSAPTVINTDRLTKRFGDEYAVREVTTEVGRGAIHGILGPNGAGKTTLQKLLLGMVRPTSGSGTVLGLDIVTQSERIRQDVAFVPEDKLVYERMRVSQFIAFYSSFFPAWSERFVEELIRRWEIPPTKQIRKLSKGVRAKVMLAVALARQPKVLLMDEPTIDLDPASADEIFSVLAQWVAERDNSIVLSTHRMDEGERICDHVSIMKEGRIVAGGELDDLRSAWKTIRQNGTPPDGVEAWAGVRCVHTNGRFTSIVVDTDADAIATRLRQAGGDHIEVVNMNLRSIYLAAVGHERGRLDDLLEILA